MGLCEGEFVVPDDFNDPLPEEDAISNPDNEVYLSVVSVWEAVIKYQIGKLPLPESPEIYLLNE